jgi:dUTP pyrophosphatase
MIVRFKKLDENAVTPTYGKPGDACMDLTAISKMYDANGNIVYGTGIAMEIPQGYVGLVFQRSSVASKDIILTNCVGVIDSGYRGEIMAKFKNIDPDNKFNKLSPEYNIGDRVAQIMILPIPYIELELAAELSESARGCGGYGSTGK